MNIPNVERALQLSVRLKQELELGWVDVEQRNRPRHVFARSRRPNRSHADVGSSSELVHGHQ